MLSKSDLEMRAKHAELSGPPVMPQPDDTTDDKDWHLQPVVSMYLYCPNNKCRSLHVDENEWAATPHRKHQCQFCGTEWFAGAELPSGFHVFPFPTRGIAMTANSNESGV